MLYNRHMITSDRLHIAGRRPKRITIQGVAGCYHDAAARGYFAGEEIDTIQCDSFQEMFDTLAADASLLGIMAIENTIAGSLLQEPRVAQGVQHADCR